MAGLLIPGDDAPADDAIVAELRRWAATPFEWADDNCGLAVLRYVERVRGRALEPAPRFRDRIGAERMLRRAGGYIAYADWAMGQLGCEATDAPERGDVGLIPLEAGLTAAIHLGGRMWAARGDRAAVIQPAVASMVWRVRCPRR